MSDDDKHEQTSDTAREASKNPANYERATIQKAEPARLRREDLKQAAKLNSDIERLEELGRMMSAYQVSEVKLMPTVAGPDNRSLDNHVFSASGESTGPFAEFQFPVLLRNRIKQGIEEWLEEQIEEKQRALRQLGVG